MEESRAAAAEAEAEAAAAAEAEAAAAAVRRCLVRHAQLLRLDTVSALSWQRRPRWRRRGTAGVWGFRQDVPQRYGVAAGLHNIEAARTGLKSCRCRWHEPAQLTRVLIMGTVRGFNRCPKSVLSGFPSL